MTLGLLPARGRTLASLDARTATDAQAYAESFDVVDLAADPRAARDCLVIRVMNLNGVRPALWAKVRWGTPYVLQLGYDHADLARLYGRRTRALAWRALRTAACFGAAGIIVSAEGLARRWRLRQRFPHVPLRVIPNGVDLMRFWPGPRPDPLRVIVAGRLAPEKNLLALVEAAAGLGATLEFVGDGPLRQEIAAAARRHGVVCFLPGHVSYEEVASRMGRAGVFALPSFSEGSPKALFEAMASGLRCVVSDRVPDVERMPIVRCGVDAASIGAALRQALAGPDLGPDARAYAEQHHDLRQTLAQEIAFVREVAGL